MAAAPGVQACRVAWNDGWMGEVVTVSPGAVEHILPSLAARPPRPFAVFSAGIGSGDTGA